ncbi:hypothetical protein DFJ58DRAFT_789283 [Suillus subalutaceus]|uniref:uncharacterized protein n=1 Tax=Suillus subalutaceus TaxID=48586 RepID=UPI001B8620F7|nr:uncharacterized protein DFJ58DRAFT_789283 [Suillus subalutaceus]KAG1853716.1 hypothetical protein DFJ58DRAFT_789283 [Suillus subalutaceus]
MFPNSPYRHIPFFAQTPAGFRMLNPSLKNPYFRPSANTARVGRPPTKATVPKVFKKSAPKAFPSQIIHPRRKHCHKRFTYHLTVTRPGLRRKGPRFCNPAKLRREKAASALNDLENVALKTMQAGGMTAEDRIFLKQLEDLRLDQLRSHTLGDAREVVARAEALGPLRELEHVERDRQAALRLEEKPRRQKEEEESRRLEEERQRQEEEKRRQEEARRRQEEARRRAEELARLREQRERELQAKREAFRKAQEEAERRAREQAEQRLREEARRQERQRQEELSRNKAQADLVAFFQLYDAKWQELKLSQKLTSVMLFEMPWPTFQQGCASPDDISRRSTKSRKDRLKVEILRFHPDKFNSNIVRKLRECDREKASEIAGALARILTNMMTEEVQKEKDQ